MNKSKDFRQYETKGKLNIQNITEIRSEVSKQYGSACDVCNAPNPEWQYDVADYQMPAAIIVSKTPSHPNLQHLRPGINIQVSTNGWTLCEACHLVMQTYEPSDNLNSSICIASLIGRFEDQRGYAVEPLIGAMLAEHFRRFIENIKPGSMPRKVR